jgi:TonB family protein
MISVLLFAAAAANFAPPHLSEKEARRFIDIYPPKAARNKQSAAAVVDATVDPKGRISNCKTLRTLGDEPLIDRICGLVEKMKIEPATVGGAPAYGVFHDLVSFTLTGSNLAKELAQFTVPSDLELQVNKLPVGQSTLRVKANVLVDATGKPQACYAASDVPQDYADVVCTQVSGITFGTLKDDAGKPVSYVRSMIVDFDLASASPASGG